MSSIKKISYKRNGKLISYNKRLPIKKVMRKPPCDDDYQEISRKPFKNWKGRTLYCRKKNNIKELRNQITILQSLQKQLEAELMKKNNNKLVNKLKGNLEELKQEKQNLQNELNDQRNNVNAALITDLNNIKEDLKTCNNDKNNINKQLQDILKQHNQLIQVRDALRGEVIRLENKIKQDEDKMKKEMKTCTYEKNVLLQKLDIIQGARQKLEEEKLKWSDNAQLRSQLDQKILLEDSLKEQIRNFNDNCNDKISKLNEQLSESNNKLNECQQKFKDLSDKLNDLNKERDKLKRDLKDCSNKNKILNDELKQSQLDIVDLKNQINVLNENIKKSKNEKEQYENKLNKLEKDKDKIESESAKIKNKYDEQLNKINTLQQVQQEAENRYGNINDDNKKEILKCKENMRNLQINYDKLDKQYQTITQQLENYKNSNISEKYNDLIKERDNLIEQTKNLQKDIDQLNKQGKDKDKLINNLQEQLKEKDTVIQNLRNNETGLLEEFKKYGMEMEDKVEKLQADIQRLLKKEDVPVSIILNEKENKIVGVVNNEGVVEALPQEIPNAPEFENIFPVVNVDKQDKKNLLEDIRKGKELKKNKSDIERAPKETVDLLKDIQQGKTLNKVIRCDIGFVWDPKENRCTPVVKSEENPLQAALRSSLEKNRAFIEQEPEEENQEEWE